MNRIILCLLTLALLLGLSGCAADEAPPMVQLTPPQDVTTLTVSVYNQGSVNIYQELARAFTEIHPDIWVDFIDNSPSEYETRLSLMMNGGDGPDVIWVKQGDTIPAMTENHLLADLTDLIHRDGINLNDYGGMAAHFENDGHCYALPVSCGYYVLYYNKDIFDKAGLPYPSNDMTWQQFEELAEKLSSGEGPQRQYGALFHTWNACVQNWGVADGHTILDDDLSFFKPYYEMVLRMQNETHSCMDYAELKLNSLNYLDLFCQGRIAMLPMGTWMITHLTSDNSATVNWGVASLPHAENRPASCTVGNVTPLAISSRTPHLEAAWEFVKFVSSQQGALIHSKLGYIPARINPETIQLFSQCPGMPADMAEALMPLRITFDRPIHPQVSEIDRMLNEQHNLIMLGLVSVDEGITEMERMSREIRGAA